MSTPTSPTLPTHPLSPWAARFSSGLHIKNFPDSIWDNSSHSGLAPELPRFDDPIHYADMTGKLPIRDPPTSHEELDKLFRSEGYQIVALKGIRTWEAAILNRWVRFSAKTGNISAGHLLSDAGEYAKVLQAIFDSETIKVDESRWAPWLQKAQWLNWVETSPLGGGEARTWTVDNEKIWSTLRISLELVDRIFKTLIDERHDALQTLLFGRIELWRDAIPHSMGKEPYENARVLLSHSQEQYIARLNGTPCQYDSMTQHSKSEWTEKLEDLLSLLLFGFNIFDGVDGMHCNLPGSTITGITILNIQKLDILLNDTKLTIGERCIMHVYIAVTLVHEITHAITMARMMRLVPGELQSEPLYGFQEPIVDCEGISEIGEWFEGQVFGGLCWAHDIPISASLLEVPSLLRWVEKHAPGAWMNGDAKSKMYYIPTSWHSRIMSEDFWKAPGVPQKSKNFFHRPSVFINESFSTGIISGDWEETQAIYPDPQIDTYEEDLRIVQHWHNRQNTWKYLRPAWYDDEYFQWKYSPWFHLTGRWEIETFADAFADRDEIGCAIIAQKLADRVGWRRDLATFNQYIPQVGGNFHPNWVFHCIGLLMMAAIPIREKRIEREGNDQEKTIIFNPSRNMVTTYGLEADIKLEQISTGNIQQRHAEKSELFDHVNGRGQIEDGFTQFDYLALAVDVVSRVTSQAVVHFSWISAIKSAIQKLSEDRQELQAKYPDGHADRWASDWAFETPKYDKERGTYNADGSTRVLKFDAVSRRYGW